MKILLTAPPGMGKTTIVHKVREGFKGKKYGVVAREIRNEQNERVGFEFVNQQNNSQVFAHKSAINSEFIVGSKYFVDLKVIDNFAVTALKEGLNDLTCLIFVDEIGRMQAFSKKFLAMVSQLLDNDSNLLGTIVYDQEPWSIVFKQHPKIILLEVTLRNREQLPDVLLSLFNNMEYFNQLEQNLQEYIFTLTTNYFKNGQLIQVKKLFKNAIFYLTQGNVQTLTTPGTYIVKGDTRSHHVEMQSTDYNCDCDLFNGLGQYQGQAGECSHIQAIKLLQYRET